MLIATDYARKMSLDMRMIDKNRYDDHIDNKASHCAAKIAEYYKKYDAQKGTQFVFSDLGTYKPGEWNPCSEIKRKLVENHNIPAHEIRFIQEAKTETARKAMIKAMNDGHVRVLFGSTEMLGTGVNAQQRAVAVHHLDSPWRPSDLEQREGRAIRKGNETAGLYAGNKVDVIIYAVEKSLDSYKFNLLQNKQLFISQLKTNNMGTRTIDEGSMDEKSGMNFSEYVAILSGNTDLLEKARLEKKAAALESERKSFGQNKASSGYKLQDIVLQVDVHRETAKRIKGDWKDFQSRVQKDADGAFLNPVRLKDLDSSDPKVIGAKLNETAGKASTNGEYFTIGTLYGFTLLVKTENSQKEGLLRENRFFVEGGGNVKYSYNNGHIAGDPVLASQNFLKALEKMPSLIETHEAKAAELAKNIPELQAVVNSAWRREDELKDLKTELAALDRKIQLSLKPVDTGEDSKGESQQGKPLHLDIERLQDFKQAMGKLYASVSGGKDSGVMLDIIRRFVDKTVPAVFCNTGNEYPEVVKFVRQMNNVTVIRPEIHIGQLIEKYGFPLISKEQSQYINQAKHTKSGKLLHVRLYGGEKGAGKISERWKFMMDAPFDVSEKCCTYLKRKPFEKFHKETGLFPVIGTMAGESRLRLQKWMKHGCNSFETNMIASYPLSVWTENDVWAYIRRLNLPCSPIYDMGIKRTGCMVCVIPTKIKSKPF